MSTSSTSSSRSRRSSRRMIGLAEPPLELNVGNFISTSNGNNNNNNNRNSILLISNTRSTANSCNNNSTTSNCTNNERISNVLQSSSNNSTGNNSNNSEVLVAKSSMRFIQGRPYIVPKSELARVVVMQNSDDSNDNDINNNNNNNNYNNTTSRIQVPVSNLTMLLNEQLGISNVEIQETQETQEQQISEMTLQVPTITNTDDSPVPSVLVRNNQIVPTRRNSYNATAVATATTGATTGAATGVAAYTYTTIVGSGSSVSEADSASGPPPRQCQSTSKPKGIVLGSSAPSHLTAQSRVVMFEPPDRIHNANANANTTNSDTTYVPDKLPTYINDNNINIQQQPKHISSSSRETFSNRVRRCMSSKELGTLAPPSGSPYVTMIYQMEALEDEMRLKLASMRRSDVHGLALAPPDTTTATTTTNTNANNTMMHSDETSTSSVSSSRAHPELANEMRTRRRAEHTQAVVDDLCKIVADLFIAESKLLNPYNYGVVPTSITTSTTTSTITTEEKTLQQQQHAIIQRSIQEFVTSLPSRYVFSADTPSEVLLHMRLMAAVRNDTSKAVVHIHNFSDTNTNTNNTNNYNYSNLTVKTTTATTTTPYGGMMGTNNNHSLRLVTISCQDAVGLLEYITRLLSSGGSRVLDADVMLSSDGIVLDRFVVEMNGRLRLDKLSNSIESFLSTKVNNNTTNDRNVDESPGSPKIDSSSDEMNHQRHRHRHHQQQQQINSNSPSSPLWNDIEPTGPLYYKVDNKTPESRVWDDEKSIQEIKTAVPLTEFLTKSNSQADFRACPPLLPTMFRKSGHNTSSSSSSTQSFPNFRLSMNNSMSMSRNISEIVPIPRNDDNNTRQEEQAGTTSTTTITTSTSGKVKQNKRVLLDRPAASFLDDFDDDDADDNDSRRRRRPTTTNDSVGVLDYVTVPPYAAFGLEQRVVPLIPFDELMLIETIGSGRVSTIYRAAWQKPITSTSTTSSASIMGGGVGVGAAAANQGYIHQMVALKVAMVNPVTNNPTNVDELRREADIAARLEHPNVVELVGVAADTECFCLAYDYCDGGSLLSLLSDHTRYYEYLPIALDIANGMAYLHSRNVIHRDLKPSNILMTRDNRAKIADFGMSVANFGQELTAETGTYRYMAPEVIRHESYSSNADVYSFGLVLWQIITREVPFANLTPIQAAYAVAEGRRPVIPSDTPRRLREIISFCWHQDSNRRPSFTYITMALADYAKMAFSPANVGAMTLQIANETLASVEGNSTVNVDISTPVGPYLVPGGSTTSTTLLFGLSRHDSFHSNLGLEIE